MRHVLYILSVVAGRISATGASISAGGLVATQGGASRNDVAYIDLMTAPEIAQANPHLSVLRELWDSTEFSYKIEQSRGLTLFLPTNVAFSRYGVPDLMPCLPYAAATEMLSSLMLAENIHGAEELDGAYNKTTVSGVVITLKISTETPPDASAQPSSGLLPEVARRRSNLTILLDDTIVSSVDAKGVDSANGVTYTIDNLILSSSAKGALSKAKRECDAKQAFQGSLRPLDVPVHIDQTNRHHWFWGRVGGTPLDKLQPPLPANGVLETTAIKGPAPKTVGVIQRKEKSSAGVLA